MTGTESYRRALILILLGLVAFTARVDAAKVKVWQQHQSSQYDKAQFQNAVVTNEGALKLSKLVKPLATIDAMHVWDVLEDKAGNLIAATGDDGKLFRISPDGKVKELTQKDTQVLSLTQTPDGTVYAGTGPTGAILRIPPGGAPQVLIDNLDAYVWSLAYWPETKMLLAGTGPKGRILQIAPEGKSSVFYATKQEHVLCLAPGGPYLYAGTDKGGLVHRIDAKGKGFVLFHAAQNEVHSLLVAGNSLFLGTSSPVTRKNAKPATSSVSFDDTVLAQDKSAGSSLFSPPTVGENSLYRVSADGAQRELFRDKVLILSLARKGQSILIGTGMQGQLFEVDEATKERSELLRLDHGQIHRILQRKDSSYVLATGDPGKLYTLEDRFATKGTVLSEVLDAKIPSHWGQLSWNATAPSGSTATIAVRSGNVAEPDDTWSDWSSELTASPAKAAAPLARYLQYRVTLTSDRAGVTPEVRGITLRYQTTNQAPEIATFDVPDLDSTNLDNPRKLKLKWSASDPNDDELTYNLWMRKEGWKDWVRIEESLDSKTYDWDTTSIPSGLYRLKVTATDRKDNSEENALTAEKISAWAPVAHEAPKVEIKVAAIEGDQAVIEAKATDPLVRLTEASFALNGKKSENVFPSDGLFDSRSETFRFRTPALRPGTYVLVLRVRDAAGNTGSGDVVFAIDGKK